MRRIFTISALAVLALAGVGRAGGLGLCCKTHCTCPPCDCPDCSCPCDHRHNLALFGGHAHKYIEGLYDECCCTRIKAVKKLGCRLHADFCCDPAVLDALIGALLCDPCWEVRRAAAWSLFGQDARTDQVILALYISSRLDPHYMVRTRALEAIDLLTLCRRKCYDGLYKSGDALISQLRKLNYKPGSHGCRVRFAEAYAACTGSDEHTPALAGPAEGAPPVPAAPAAPQAPAPGRQPETIGAPRPGR